MNTSIVIGLTNGDEGKGLMTDYLCRKAEKPLVVRFCGGFNAGHTVVFGDKRHVFSHFGSGCFRGADTFWSKYCPMHPTSLIRERDALIGYGLNPVIYIDPLAPVTTPYDILYNRILEYDRSMNSKSHGSVGVGIGSTIERNLTPYKLYAQDILYPAVLQQKLEAVKNYYSDILLNKFPAFNFYGKDISVLIGNIFSEDKIKFNLDKSLKLFLEAIEKCKKYIKLKTESEMFIKDHNPYDDFIFEGSQGILLDMDFGFFPNVTRTNTTSKNAMEIIERNDLCKPDIYYMTRAYQTRHGNGYMSDTRDLKLINNENETNVQHDWQGNFRTGVLDFDLLNYAIGCDNNFTSYCPKHLVVTCLDQIKGDLCAIKDDGMTQIVIKDDKQWFDNIKMPITKLFKSHSDCSDNLKDGIYLHDLTKQYS